jgi:hypothetical protein
LPLVAALPGKLHTPILLLGGLNSAAVEVSPGDPITVGSSGEIGAVDFEAGKLLVVIAVNIEDGNGTSELRFRFPGFVYCAS